MKYTPQRIDAELQNLQIMVEKFKLFGIATGDYGDPSWGLENGFHNLRCSHISAHQDHEGRYSDKMQTEARMAVQQLNYLAGLIKHAQPLLKELTRRQPPVTKRKKWTSQPFTYK